MNRMPCKQIIQCNVVHSKILLWYVELSIEVSFHYERVLNVWIWQYYTSKYGYGNYLKTWIKEFEIITWNIDLHTSGLINSGHRNLL